MDRILTNLQIKWLSYLKLLNDYEDAYFEKHELTKKLCNFIENNYPGQENEIGEELSVLKKKGFINYDYTKNATGSLIIEKIQMKKEGLDYLVMLAEDFVEKAEQNKNILLILEELNGSITQMQKKSLLDKLISYTSLGTNIVTIGSACFSMVGIPQGIIPIICEYTKAIIKLKK